MDWANDIIKVAKEKTELEMGIAVEKEHKDVYEYFKDLLEKNDIKMPLTLDEFAEKIANAHIKEMKNYYTELKKMESANKKG